MLCGVISSYLTGEHPGPANYVNLLAKSALMQGFNTLDQWGRFDEAFAALRQWEAEGRLVHRQTIFDGHRVVRRRPQRVVHRSQHRQDAGQGRRTHAGLSAEGPVRRSSVWDHLRMEPQDDPEARIRELERPLTNQAYTSELGVSHGYASPPSPPPPMPPMADTISFGTTRPRSTGRVWWIVIAAFILGVVGLVVGILVYFGNVSSRSTVTFSTRPSMYGGDGSFPQVPSREPEISVEPSTSIAPRDGRLSVSGVGKEETIECNDSDISVSGMSNTVVLIGHCANVTVSGVKNVVTVDTSDTISASGFENQVTYHSGSPTIQNASSDNVVKQG